MWINETRLAVIDLETTGPDPATAMPVQIGVLQIDHGVIEARWESYINPGVAIPPEATAVHGISDAMVESAPGIVDLYPEIRTRLRGRYLIGYNAAHYDVPILRRLLGSGSNIDPVDPLIWIRDFDRYVRGKGRHKLSNVADRYKLPKFASHNALGDCETTWCLLCLLAPKMPETLTETLRVQKELSVAQEKEHAEYLASQKNLT